MAAFVERTGTGGFTQLADETAELWDDFGAEIRSSFLFVDGDTGEARRTGYGQMDEEALRQYVEDLLA
jgi:hypothetical protein